MALQVESKGVIKKVSGKCLPEGNRTLSCAVCVIGVGESEPSKSRKLIGVIEEVGILFCATYCESRKESVEPESTSIENLRIEEVFSDSSRIGILVTNGIVRDRS